MATLLLFLFTASVISTKQVKICAEGRSRTGTDINIRGILSPLRLPIPPPRHSSHEAAIGVEPMNRDFADLRLSHLATPPKKMSGRRGSNSRPPPWQGGVLPLNYSRLIYKKYTDKIFIMQDFF